MDRRRAEPAELTGKKIRDAISDAVLGGKDAAIGKNDLCIGQKRTLAHARKETKRRLIPKSAVFFYFSSSLGALPSSSSTDLAPDSITLTFI